MSDNNKVLLKEVRADFYRLRDFEIKHLWQRSVFLTAFLVLCFTGYGYSLSRMLDGVCENTCEIKTLLLHEIACGISLLGITFSIIWIMMAKGSKAWYEVYERRILDIESDIDLKISEGYRMCSPAIPRQLDHKLFSTAAGKYSVSRLNIVIGIILLVTWLILWSIHYCNCLLLIYRQSSVPNGCNVFITHFVFVIFVAVLLCIILVTAVCNKWAESGALQKE